MTGQNTLGLGLIRQPKTVLFGPGQRGQLGRYAAKLGSRVLVITDERMATTEEFRAMIEDLKANGAITAVYDRALPDLPRQNVLDVLRSHGGDNIEVIVGIGGGSCMDLAKAVSAVLAHGGDVRDYFGEFAVPGPCVPLITIPTTAGTGAEVTSLSIVYDEEVEMKMAIADPNITPAIALIDPWLTLTCPAGLTAATAADAISHLVEAFTAKPKNPTADQLAREIYVGKNRLTDMFCLNGLELMNRSLEKVVRDPSDLDARSDVMYAAYCAGMAINTTGTAAAHAIQSPMAAYGHTPHGFGVGALLPYVMRFNLPYSESEFAEIGRALGVARSEQTTEEQSRAGISRIEALLEATGTPLELESIGIKPDYFRKIATSSLKASRLVLNNPAPMTEETITALLHRAHSGDRRWWSTP
tara:strand:+ start:268 stop:1512 length:1245 start_codon:yes stop_codon:yes gene_type:complete